MSVSKKIRPKVRDSILQSLKAGVVPRQGLQHIQVGRAGEVGALLRDIERLTDGGSSFRLIIGDYGAGKTFFLNLIRSIALEKKMVSVNADLTPDRRLQATGGQARTLYAELMRNMSTRTKPEGGALASVVERFVTTALNQARKREISPEMVIQERLENLSEMVGGYDFAQVIAAYWRGHDSGNDQLKSDAVRWLRGEFTTKTDARMALGVRSFVDDSTFYDHLKLMARFIKLAGYSGLMVTLDEMVNLFKITHSKSRNANYEQILRILNDSMQGISVGMGFLMGGTPEFLLDTRRGLYSYEALQSRLAQNTFAKEGLVDLSGPVINLASLSPEDMYVLLGKLRHVHSAGDESAYLVPESALKSFMDHCQRRIGEAYFRTPRTTIKSFLDLLSILEQNPNASWEDLIGKIPVEADSTPANEVNEISEEDDDVLSSFQL